jgi:Holliday junction resolvasome RuvABC endonuclease subunit
MLKVIGLDLSITATGIALPDGTTRTIASKAKGDARLTDICIEVAKAAADEDVALVVIEELPPIRANSLALTGMVQGVVRLLLMELNLPYALVPPASLKKYATGRGNATKPDMRMALFQRAQLDLRDDNQVDAWWLRAAGLDHLGAPPVALPAAQRAALNNITWPAVRETANA